MRDNDLRTYLVRDILTMLGVLGFLVGVLMLVAILAGRMSGP